MKAQEKPEAFTSSVRTKFSKGMEEKMAHDAGGYPCPCCGSLTLSEGTHETFEICPVCNWGNDDFQFHHPNFQDGVNQISLNKAKLNYKKFGASFSQAKAVNHPLPDEFLYANSPLMNRARIGKELKAELAKGYDVDRIASWALPIWRDDMDWSDREQTLSADPELDDIVQSIAFMDEPQFEIPAEELAKIADMLITTEEELSDPIPEIKDIALSVKGIWLMCPLCQETWESVSRYGMVRCPKCSSKLHNPEFSSQKELDVQNNSASENGSQTIPEAKNFIMKAQERLAAFITSVRTRFSKGTDEKNLF